MSEVITITAIRTEALNAATRCLSDRCCVGQRTATPTAAGEPHEVYSPMTLLRYNSCSFLFY